MADAHLHQLNARIPASTVLRHPGLHSLQTKGATVAFMQTVTARCTNLKELDLGLFEPCVGKCMDACAGTGAQCMAVAKLYEYIQVCINDMEQIWRNPA